MARGFRYVRNPAPAPAKGRYFSVPGYGSAGRRIRGVSTPGFRYVPNPLFPALVASSVEMVALMGEKADKGAEIAESIAPIGEGVGGHYKDQIHGTSGINNGVAMGRINAWKFTSGFLEFGTSDTPKFAVLRRAVESLGVKFSPSR